MIRSKPCKLCNSVYHTAAFCRDRKTLAIKKAPKPKKRNRSKVKKELMVLIKDFIKKRDNYTDQRSGEKVSGKNCHASHVLPVGSHSNMQFDPENMIVLSYRNHILWWHKNPVEAGEFFKQTFPERYIYLKERSLIAPKLPTYRLEEMIIYYKGLLK